MSRLARARASACRLRAGFSPTRPRAYARTTNLGRAATRGFSFVEMMIVIVIMGVLLAVTIPSMRGLQNRQRLSTGARDVAVLFRYARGQAIFGESTVEVRLDIATNRYRLDKTPEIEAGRSRSRERGQRGLDERVRDLPRDVSFDEVFVWVDQINERGHVAVEFYPNGTVSPIILMLKDKDGKMMTVDLARASGKVRIIKGRAKKTDLPGQTGVIKQRIVVEE